MSILLKVVVLIFSLSIIYDLFLKWRKLQITLGFMIVFGGAAALVLVFVMSPGLADWFFSFFGIYSGTNGAFFIAICVLVILVKRLYERLIALEARQTAIVREIALSEAEEKE